MSAKIAVVSGGTKGIGKAIVISFMQNGFDVISCARNQEALSALESELNAGQFTGALHVFRADVSRKAEVDSFVQFIRLKTDRVDVLVNNAGVFMPGEISTEAEGNLDLMMNTNLYSAYHLTRALIADMKDRKSGDIFNICSVASQMAYPNGGSYSISKFAMYGMTKGLREELKPYGVRVTAVLPGATRTASWDGVDLPEERFINPEDVADALWAAYALSRNAVVEDLIIRPQLGDI